MTESLPPEDSAATARPTPQITLITKPGCHLCVLARSVVTRVAQDMSVGWREVSIEDIDSPDPMMWEQLPVTLIDGEPHDYWRVNETRLRASLTARLNGQEPQN